MSIDEFLASKLAVLERSQRRRRTVNYEPLSSAEYALPDGKVAVQFASNDYLGLAKHPELAEAAYRASRTYGVGAGASPLVTGSNELLTRVEAQLATFSGKPAAILFESGYAANVGTVDALVGGGDVIFADAYNHSSLKTGAKLSGAEVREYKHLDYEELASMLVTSRHHYRHALLISDGIFSMDGDRANVSRLRELANHWDCWLMVDDAHAIGVWPLASEQADVLMATCSKALGVQGGFVAGSEMLVDYLRQRAKTYVYSTAPSPAILGALEKSLELLHMEPWRAQQLRRHVEAMDCECQISVVTAPGISAALAWEGAALEAGYLIRAIRPPTAPTARLRICLSAAHSHEQVQSLREWLRCLPKVCSAR